MARRSLLATFMASAVVVSTGCGRSFLVQYIDRPFTLAELETYESDAMLKIGAAAIELHLTRGEGANYLDVNGDFVCPVLVAGDITVRIDGEEMEQVSPGGFESTACLPAVFRSTAQAEKRFDGFEMTVDDGETSWSIVVGPVSFHVEPTVSKCVANTFGAPLVDPPCEAAETDEEGLMLFREGFSYALELQEPTTNSAITGVTHRPTMSISEVRRESGSVIDCATSPNQLCTFGTEIYPSRHFVWGLNDGDAATVESVVVGKHVYPLSDEQANAHAEGVEQALLACDGPTRCWLDWFQFDETPGVGLFEFGGPLRFRWVPAEPGTRGGDCENDRECDEPFLCREGSCESADPS